MNSMEKVITNIKMYKSEIIEMFIKFIHFILKYLFKLLKTAFLLFFMSSFLQYGHEKRFEFAEDEVWAFIYLIFSCQILCDCILYALSFLESASKNKTSDAEKRTKESDVDLERKACHEAGHAIIAKLLDIEVTKISILKDYDIGGYVSLNYSLIPNEEDLKKRIMILYAGVLAEKLLLGTTSIGCMGSERSDFEAANVYLKQYVVITDEEVSFTGNDPEIENKMIQLSKKLREKTELLLKENINEVEELKNKLLVSKEIVISS